MQSLVHDHITKEVERIGQRHRPTSPLIFAAHLKDRVYLPCLRAYPSENSTLLVRPQSGEPYLQFEPKSLGYLAYANCIVHGDYIESVEPSPYFLPTWIYEHLIKAESRGEYHALRIRMKDMQEFTLLGGLGLGCYRPPDGYEWADIEEAILGYDYHPINPIHPMVVFYCILVGLSDVTIKEAEQGAAANP